MKAKEIDIEESKNFITTHAAACHPYECCGVIYRKGQKQEVMCGRNIATDPRHTFCLHPDDYAKAEDEGEILAIYHSHCDEAVAPSVADKACAEKHELPMIVVSATKQDDGSFVYAWELYEPTGWKPDLAGRPFVDGVLDCITLVQDYYERQHGIKLPDIARKPDWWRKIGDAEPPNLYGEHLPKNGFVQIDKSTIQGDDLILMQLDSTVPNHCAIYVGDGMMLHHPPGHLSGYHPYVCERGYYALSTVSFWRHKKLFHVEHKSSRGAAVRFDQNSKPFPGLKIQQ